jgi:hypothetical protein
MTEAEAIQFLENRKRHMFGGREDMSRGEVVSLIRRGNTATMLSGSSLFGTASFLLSIPHRSGYTLLFAAAAIVLGFSIIGFSAWSHVRLRQACRALNYATDGSSRLSGSR